MCESGLRLCSGSSSVTLLEERRVSLGDAAHTFSCWWGIKLARTLLITSRKWNWKSLLVQANTYPMFLWMPGIKSYLAASGTLGSLEECEAQDSILHVKRNHTDWDQLQRVMTISFKGIISHYYFIIKCATQTHTNTGTIVNKLAMQSLLTTFPNKPMQGCSFLKPGIVLIGKIPWLLLIFILCL